MKGYDFIARREFFDLPPASVPGDAATPRREFVAACRAVELRRFMGAFGWDESSVLESLNIDENVRYTSYENYDFVSLIHLEADAEGGLSQREVNVFFAREYLVVVMPDSAGPRLQRLCDKLLGLASFASNRRAPLIYLYYAFFDGLASDFADTLERLEDQMEELAEEIENAPDQSQSATIGRMRKTAYACKKHLRALTYIGGQLLVDDNKLLGREHLLRYFNGVNTRLMKLYDFADNLFALSHELLHAFESKFSAKMNETVSKLTFITMLFAPLTLIAGIYGMNFDYMPELRHKLGYPASIALMAVIAIGMYVFLKRKKLI